MSVVTKPTVVVLGGSGLLGSALCKTLSKTFNVVAIQRTKCIELSDVAYFYADLIDPVALSTILDNLPSNKIIIDAVLDKHNAATITQNRQRATQSITNAICKRTDIHEIIVISSTAVLSPWLLKTGYARVKDVQNIAYIASGINADFFLCPQIIQAASQSSMGAAINPHDKLVINLMDAVRIVEKICITSLYTRSVGPILYYPSRESCQTVIATYDVTRMRALTVLSTAMFDWLFKPSKRHYHERRLTYALLSLIPKSLRVKYDHHTMSNILISRYCQRRSLHRATVNVS